MRSSPSRPNPLTMRYDSPALAFIFVLTLFASCTKDPQEYISFDKAFGGSRLDMASSIVKTPDGGYAIAGSTESSDGDLSSPAGHAGFSSDAWIFKLNRTGQLQWSKRLGGTGTDLAKCIINTADGGLITAGSSETADGDVSGNRGEADAWIIKLDKDGKVQWKKNYGGSKRDIANSIAQDANGNYIFTGTSFSTDGDLSSASGESDLWVVKLDSGGNILWTKSLGSNGSDVGSSVVNSPDGGYLVAGETSGPSGMPGYHGNSDILVVKLASDGSLIWQKAFGGTNVERAASVVPSQSGGFVISALTSSSNGDLHTSRSNPDTWLFEINNLGNIIWEKAYQTPQTEEPSQIGANNDGYTVTGSARPASVSTLSQFMFISVDPDGKLLTRKATQRKAAEMGSAQVLVNGSKYIIAGSSSSLTAGTDAWIFTLDL